jgi:hypothetical protein
LIAWPRAEEQPHLADVCGIHAAPSLWPPTSKGHHHQHNPPHPPRPPARHGYSLAHGSFQRTKMRFTLHARLLCERWLDRGWLAAGVPAPRDGSGGEGQCTDRQCTNDACSPSAQNDGSCDPCHLAPSALGNVRIPPCESFLTSMLRNSTLGIHTYTNQT